MSMPLRHPADLYPISFSFFSACSNQTHGMRAVSGGWLARDSTGRSVAGDVGCTSRNTNRSQSQSKMVDRPYYRQCRLSRSSAQKTKKIGAFSYCTPQLGYLAGHRARSAIVPWARLCMMLEESKQPADDEEVLIVDGEEAILPEVPATSIRMRHVCMHLE